MCVETRKVRLFKCVKKMFKTSIRNMEREDIEICQIALKLVLPCNVRSKSGFLVFPPAPQPVLDVPVTYFTQAYHLTEKIVKN